MASSFDTPAFCRARDAYRAAREEQRNKIVRRLKAAGYKGVAPKTGAPKSLTAHGGHGLARYTNGGRIDPPHDLRNWLWVDARRPDGAVVRVMLQSFDQDSRTHNEHALLDRISIGAVPESIHDSRWLTTTELELPLDEAGLNRLVKLLEAVR